MSLLPDVSSMRSDCSSRISFKRSDKTLYTLNLATNGFSLAIQAFIEKIFLFFDNIDLYKLGTGSIRMPVQLRSNSKKV